MHWQERYLPPSISPWQGRRDLPPQSCLFQHITLLNLTQPLPSINTPAFALLGFNCDTGIQRNQGRMGASEGPAAIRAMAARLALPQQPAICFDAGNIICANNELEEAQATLAAAVTVLLQANITPIVLGGGHELAWGHYRGIREHLQQKPLGIINFDAHFDMRPLLNDEQGTSGTPFLQMAHDHQERHLPFHYYCLGIQPASNIPLLFEHADTYDVHYLTGDEVMNDQQKTNTFLQTILQQHDHLYVSICLDVFAAAYAPGVSAPQACGITPWQVIPLLRQLRNSGKVISYDIAELSPPFDVDQRTARLAAQFVHEIISHP